MSKSFIPKLFGLSMCALALLAATPTWATKKSTSATASTATATDTGDSTAAKKTKAKKPKVVKIKFLPSSEETSPQRVARLKRECKGAVNAGACEGYTR